jgi:hypothetical protein
LGINDKRFSNVAVTQGPFPLNAGQYGVTVTATFGGGSVTLQRLGPDGSTFVTCMPAFTVAGYASAFLPAGTYQLLIATATAVFVDINTVLGFN